MSSHTPPGTDTDNHTGLSYMPCAGLHVPSRNSGLVTVGRIKIVIILSKVSTFQACPLYFRQYFAYVNTGHQDIPDIPGSPAYPAHSPALQKIHALVSPQIPDIRQHRLSGRINCFLPFIIIRPSETNALTS